MSRAAFAQHGPTYKTRKCHLHFHPDNPLKGSLHELLEASDLKLHAHVKFPILGTWIGSANFTRAEVEKKVTATIKMQDDAATFPRTQITSLLVTQCYDACRDHT